MEWTPWGRLERGFLLRLVRPAFTVQSLGTSGDPTEGEAGLEREEAGSQSCVRPNTQGGLGGGALLLLTWNRGTGRPRCFVAAQAKC